MRIAAYTIVLIGTVFCVASAYAGPLDEYKAMCEEIGFIPKSEKFADCVLELHARAKEEGPGDVREDTLSSLPTCPGNYTKRTWTHCEGQHTGIFNPIGHGTYVGQFKNGEPHGQGNFIHADGIHKYSGEWKDGVPHGQGTGTFDKGLTVVGEWRNGSVDGNATATKADGTRYIGEFKNFKSHGQGMRIFSTGTRYVGQFEDGIQRGHGSRIFGNGDRYVGEWRNDKRHGQGTYTWADGSSWSGQWINGKRERVSASKPAARRSDQGKSTHNGAAWMALGAVLRALSGVDSPIYNTPPSISAPSSSTGTTSCYKQGGQLFCSGSGGGQTGCYEQGGQLFCNSSDGSNFNCYEQGGQYFCN